MNPYEFDNEISRMSRYFGNRKITDEMRDLWYKRLGRYSVPQIQDAFEAMMSGERTFPVLDAVSGYLSSRYHAHASSERSDRKSLPIPENEVNFNLDMNPVMFQWLDHRITDHEYFGRMRLFAQNHGVNMQWGQYVELGYSLPWIEESRCEGDENWKCGTVARREKS